MCVVCIRGAWVGGWVGRWKVLGLSCLQQTHIHVHAHSAAPIVVYEVLRQWGCMSPEQLEERRAQQEGHCEEAEGHHA